MNVGSGKAINPPRPKKKKKKKNKKKTKNWNTAKAQHFIHPEVLTNFESLSILWTWILK